MGILSTVLTGESKTGIIKLADEISPIKSMGMTYLSSQESVDAQKPTVDFEELEFAYRNDPINFSAVNISKRLIMAAGLRAIEHSSQDVVKKYTEFFDSIGDVGCDLTFEELMERIFKDQMVCGNAFIENVFDEKDEKIVDLAPIDPKRIDYAKTNDGKVLLDYNGKPIGYTVKLAYGTYGEGDEIPLLYEKNIRINSQEIFLLARRVAHFKLETIGDGLYGIGFLEPGYISAIYKRNIEKGQANSIYQRGFSPLVAYVGSERRIATPKDIDAVLDKLKKLH